MLPPGEKMVLKIGCSKWAREEARRSRGTAATSRKIFLTAYNSVKGQQKTVQKLLSLIRAFKRLQEPLLLWSPHMLHILRGTVHRALSSRRGY